jgi:predicted nucleotidyltransferase
MGDLYAIWLVIDPYGRYNRHLMNVSKPYMAICPTLDSEVLAVLAGTTRPLTGREVARLTGRTSHRGVAEVLSRLVEHGLVERQEAGRALLFTLNREHLAAPAVEVLAGMRAELLRRIRGLVGAWKTAAVHVSIFGSAARGDGGTQSDIDVFVVRPDVVSEDDPRWRKQLDDLAESIERWTGNQASIAEAAEGEIERLLREDRPIVAELRSDAIGVNGADIPTLLGSK